MPWYMFMVIVMVIEDQTQEVKRCSTTAAMNTDTTIKSINTQRYGNVSHNWNEKLHRRENLTNFPAKTRGCRENVKIFDSDVVRLPYQEIFHIGNFSSSEKRSFRFDFLFAKLNIGNWILGISLGKSYFRLRLFIHPELFPRSAEQKRVHSCAGKFGIIPGKTPANAAKNRCIIPVRIS